MNIAAALALQSVPFAGLVLATIGGNRDVFVLIYVSALGLILSAAAIVDGNFAPPLMPGMPSDAHR